jgi:hypothetical protein
MQLKFHVKYTFDFLCFFVFHTKLYQEEEWYLLDARENGASVPGIKMGRPYRTVMIQDKVNNRKVMRKITEWINQV